MTKRVTRRREIDDYLRTSKGPRVILGAGLNRCPGWLSTDATPTSGQVHLDVSRRFPFPDASIDFYQSEHMIEHLGYYVALSMAKEMRRTLKPGGVARIATPDLARIADLVVRPSNRGELHLHEANGLWSSRIEARVNGSMPTPYN
ncbi:MAG: class I SAM-dependent methyltransferase, partial [Gammaproteobacteria bacterium]